MGELFILIYLFIVIPQNARKKFERKREGDDFFYHFGSGQLGCLALSVKTHSS